ncbi:hypothetical protein [Nostoc sp.]|uniref:hypothetical protein n=1 Tax=Nostoc sp. TaxID=1180 RepID=UPI002FF6FEC5
MILFSDRECDRLCSVLRMIAECIHLPQLHQRRSLKDMIIYYVKQVARPPAWALP